MAAPSIPNLNTLKLGRGRGRGRGRVPPGFSSTPEEAAAKQDTIIQKTDDDAAGSRLSAVNQGYLTDCYASRFYKGVDQPRRFPIINRGTYVRTTAIDKLVNQFLETDNESPKQIISLGAGTDTRFFRLMAENPTRRLVYHELDFATNTTRKIDTLKNDLQTLKDVTKHLDDPDSLAFGANGTSLVSPLYNIHPVDLRTITPASLPTLPNLSATTSTLILSECCLIYLSPEDNNNILTSFLQHILSPSTPVGIVIYEPIRPSDAFGRTMVSNLASRGIHMQTLQRYENLTAQKARLRQAGFTSLQCASDIDFIWNKWISPQDKDFVGKREMLDELEEWVLLAQHYCVAWGGRDGEGALFTKAWEKLPGQDDE